MMKLILGILVSSVFIYFSLQGVELQKVLIELKKANHIYLLPTVMLFFSIQFLRSLRWGVILSPLEKFGQKKLFPITCIGFMAIALIPMRIGELVRPSIISAKSRIPLSSALATIFLERLLDVLVLMGMLLLIIFTSDLPSWIVKSGSGLAIMFVFLLIFIGIFYFRTDAVMGFLAPLLKRLPQKISCRIEGILKRFIEGFSIIASPAKFFYSAALSVLIWGFSGLAIYYLFLFSNFNLPFTSALIVLFITIVGISLPAAPGFLGNFQYGCILALSIFSIPKTDALTFSMVYYFLGIGINVMLGLIFIPFEKVTFKEIKGMFSLNHASS